MSDVGDERLADVLASLGMSTPCPVVNRPVLEANLSRMADEISAKRVALRPHFKTHKSVQIAQMQADRGAAGFSCGTVGEAECLADSGFDDLFVAYPLWVDGNADRLRHLQTRARVRVGVDSVESAERLGSVVRGGLPLDIVIEVDCGLHRTGVPSGGVLPIAQAAEKSGLHVAGAFTYGGHAYTAAGAAVKAGHDEQQALLEARDALISGGFEVDVLSAGSTPTALLSAGGVVNEERPGVYVFNDRQQVEIGSCADSAVALCVAATVVSTAIPGQFVVDAGSKALSSDRLPWMQGFGNVGVRTDLVVDSLWEHHGVVKGSGGIGDARVGDIVAIRPNHVCSVVNLFDEYAITDDAGCSERWPVSARGLNS
jgi:D-serine deaminase-like pyridoxal phosphate-dependent protein